MRGEGEHGGRTPEDSSLERDDTDDRRHSSLALSFDKYQRNVGARFEVLADRSGRLMEI